MQKFIETFNWKVDEFFPNLPSKMLHFSYVMFLKRIEFYFYNICKGLASLPFKAIDQLIIEILVGFFSVPKLNFEYFTNPHRMNIWVFLEIMIDLFKQTKKPILIDWDSKRKFGRSVAFSNLNSWTQFIPTSELFKGKLNSKFCSTL